MNSVNPFELDSYYARKKFFKIFGGELRIYDSSKTNLLFFVKQKAFKLKEDIRVFADTSASHELLQISARKIVDISATYDVTDSSTGQKIGALKRQGLRSILRDSWELLDSNNNVIAKITEDSQLKAMLRRFITVLIPQSYDITMGDTLVGVLKQTFNPFLPQFNVDFSMDSSRRLDRRLGIAAVILLQIIEGKQQ